jgi:hypothetical protein
MSSAVISDDKLDYTNRAQGTLASASTKELTVATISLTGGELVGRLDDHPRAGAKVLLGLQLAITLQSLDGRTA